MKRQKIGKLVLASLLLALGSGSVTGELRHRYSFTEDTTDLVGEADGLLVNTTGAAVFEGGHLVLGNDGGQGSNAGTGDYVDLPNGIISGLGGQATFEGWVTWNGGGPWQRIFDFGMSDGGEDSSGGAVNSPYMFLTPQSGPGTYRLGYRNGVGVERVISGSAPLSSGEEHHVVVTWDEAATTAALYLNGKLIGRDTATHMTLAELEDVNNWLGRSQWPDTLFTGSYNEFRIYDHALTEEEVVESFLSGPDEVGGGQLGALQSLALEVDRADVVVGGSRVVRVLAQFEGETLEYVPGSELFEGLTLRSSNEAVATVDAAGLVNAVSVGSVTITAEMDEVEGTLSMEVVPAPLPPATLIHRYDFGGLFGAFELEDLVGDANGEVFGFLSGEGTLTLNSSNSEYVDLPNGLISAHENVTIEAWVTSHDLGGNWQRVFDFGSTTAGEDPGIGSSYGGDDYMFLAAKVGGNTSSPMRLAVREGGVENPVLETEPYPREEQVHVVVAYNFAGENVSLYLNGRLHASGPAVYPLTEINDVNNWLGRSQWSGDAFYDGTFDEFRIYEGVLSPLQVAVNRAAGPDVVLDAPGDLVGLELQLEATEVNAEALPFRVGAVADFQNVTGVDVAGVDGVVFESSDESVAVMGADGTVTPVGAGETTLRLVYGGLEVSADLRVVAVDTEEVLLHRYSFNEEPGSTMVVDSMGGKDGVLVGEGTFGGGRLELPGGAADSSAGYVDLPNWMISELPAAATFEGWVTWNGGAPWQRIFDFGNNSAGEDAHGTGSSFLFMTPSSGFGTYRVAFRRDSTVPENPVLEHSSPVPTGVQVHVVLTYDSEAGLAKLYLDGEQVDAAPVVDPLSLLFDVNNWLGRSNWPDQRLNGAFDEFRIYSGAMSDGDVATSFSRGPDVLPGEELPAEAVLAVALEEGQLRVDWPVELEGYQLESRASLVAGSEWQPVPESPQQEGDRQVVRVPIESETRFYRLKK